jgi:hypothetical protein
VPSSPGVLPLIGSCTKTGIWRSVLRLIVDTVACTCACGTGFSPAGQYLVQTGELDRRARFLAHHVSCSDHVVAEDQRLTGVRASQGRKNPDDRGLARSVRSEQPKHTPARSSRFTSPTARTVPNVVTRPLVWMAGAECRAGNFDCVENGFDSRRATCSRRPAGGASWRCERASAPDRHDSAGSS